MADTKISNLPSATAPLAGTETLPIVQSSTTKKVSADNLWAGRSITFSAPVSATPVTNGVVIIDTTGTNPATGSGGGLLFQQQNSGGVQTNYASITGYRLNSAAHDIVELAISTGSPGDARPIAKRMSFDTLGNVTVTNGNLVQGAANTGINFTANTPKAGMTSQLLNWYEEGTWTPGQGSGLTVIGTFGSSGKYTRIGRQVTVKGVLTSTTSLAWAGGAAEVTNNLPFTTEAEYPGLSYNGTYNVSAVLLASNTQVYSVEAMAATTRVTFEFTYFV